MAETQLRLPYAKKGKKVEIEEDSGAQTRWSGLFISWLQSIQAPHFRGRKMAPAAPVPEVTFPRGPLIGLPGLGGSPSLIKWLEIGGDGALR